MKSVKDELGFGYSDNVALLVLAGEEGIDVYPFLTPENKENYRKALQLRPRTIQRIINSTPKTIIRVIEAPNMPEVKSPNLSKKIYSDAEKMTEVYYYLYLFENSVRHFILEKMQKYGENWWETKVSKPVQKNVQNKINQEQKNKWHGKRGQHPIFYTVISDLSSIISVNWIDFKEDLPSQEWFNQRILEIELSRNTIAHNNPLENRDFNRLKMYFYDWAKQIASK